MKDSFEKLYKGIYLSHQKKLDEIEIEKKKYDHLSPRAKAKAIEKEKNAKYKSTGEKSKLGAEKIVFVDPEYYSIDERKGVKLVNSEDKKFKLYENIEHVSIATSMSNDILSPKIFTENDGEKFNDLVIFNEWGGERMRLDGVKDGWNFIPLETEYLRNLSEKYGTSFFSFSGVLEFKRVKTSIGYAIFFLFIPYTTPFAAHYLVTPSYDCLYYNYVYDIKSGQRILEKNYYINKKLGKDLLKSYMYEFLMLTKRPSSL
jgi:hypothetical protein